VRKIEFKEPDDDAWRKWRETCTNERKLVEAARAAGEKPPVKDLYKAQKPFFAAVDGPFGGQCAYCETIVTDNTRGEIEHYRPKSSVQDENWSPVQRPGVDGPEDHPGYYWLAYEWQNLLLSCMLCNQVGPQRAYGKGTRFPVAGQRAWEPGQEGAEEALLLNPCVDDPTEHLRFLPESGLLKPLTDRGRVTIELCGLNLRGLPEGRKRNYDDVISRLYMIVVETKHDQPRRIEELRRLKYDTRREFISVTRQAVQQSISGMLSAFTEAA